MSNIPKDDRLLQELSDLLMSFRPAFRQQRVFQRAVLLLVGEVLAFARHTVTQLLMALGQTDRDWTAWYRLFQSDRFPYDKVSEILLEEILRHVPEGEVLVVAGDGTQTPRSSPKVEGTGWLPHPRTAVFAKGLAWAQRWFHLAWLTPPEGGYSRAIPLRWIPAFTPGSKRKVTPSLSETEAARVSLQWLKENLKKLGRASQSVLMVGDGRYDNTNLWRGLPEGVILMARTARNRKLYFLPTSEMRKNRRYGKPAPTPAEVWREREGWKKITIEVRGRERRLQIKVIGPVVRQGVPDQPLFLIVVRGKYNRRVRREPLAFLVNAVRNEEGEWVLPLPIEILLFWAWQRWEIEVTHRELKSAFGLGEKQCWNPKAAVRSVQWSSWVYAVLVLAGYRAWKLQEGPSVPTRWWKGSQRWSLNTLWRSYRAAWWGGHIFQKVSLDSVLTKGDLRWLSPPMGNPVFGSTRI